MSEKKAKEARREAKEAIVPTSFTITIDVIQAGGVFMVKEVKGFPSNFVLATQLMQKALETVVNHFAMAHHQGKLDKNLNIEESKIIIPTLVPPASLN